MAVWVIYIYGMNLLVLYWTYSALESVNNATSAYCVVCETAKFASGKAIAAAETGAEHE